jgi:pectate lyase
MNRIAFLVWYVFLSATASAEPPAFPGAIGFGAKATGGRTGSVYHVTNLDDAGAGSFRDAVSASNRIIVFDVGGYISLKTAVLVKSNTTIAGQTAPGDGIGFRGGEISYANQSNAICRYIRIRPGSETESDNDDALSLYRAKNVILDHCSFEFAPWNNIDGVGDNSSGNLVTDISFQYCLVADPTYQQFGAHCESVNSDWSWFHCIFANSHNRNPLAKVNDVFVNNVLYNNSAGYTTHTSTAFKHDIINNCFIFGPASTGTDNTWYQIDKNQSIYCSGNIKDNNLDGVLNGAATTPYWYQGEGTVLTSPWSPLSGSVPVLNAQSAYRLAVSLSGTLPRDQMDSLIINQVRTLGKGSAGLTAGTVGPGGGLYTSQAQTGLGSNGYGTIRGGTKETDSDNDGMPDFWEKTIGTNANGNDAMTLASDGYANIERYINWLADPHARTTGATATDIDLLQYAAGFSGVQTTCRTDNAVNGTVALAPDGHTAKFTPADGFSGLASFAFTITGSDNTSFGGTVTVAVVPSGVVSNESRTGCATVRMIPMRLSLTAAGMLAVEGTAKGCVRIYNAAGRVMMQTAIPAAKGERLITLEGLREGLYVVQFNSNEGVFESWFVKYR